MLEKRMETYRISFLHNLFVFVDYSMANISCRSFNQSFVTCTTFDQHQSNLFRYDLSCMGKLYWRLHVHYYFCQKRKSVNCSFWYIFRSTFQFFDWVWIFTFDSIFKWRIWVRYIFIQRVNILNPFRFNCCVGNCIRVDIFFFNVLQGYKQKVRI